MYIMFIFTVSILYFVRETRRYSGDYYKRKNRKEIYYIQTNIRVIMQVERRGVRLAVATTKNVFLSETITPSGSEPLIGNHL